MAFFVGIHGHYVCRAAFTGSRQNGWKQSRAGKLGQHKFILGTDKAQAELRERKLQEIWAAVERHGRKPKPLWIEDAMQIARAVAKGGDMLLVTGRVEKPRSATQSGTTDSKLALQLF